MTSGIGGQAKAGSGRLTYNTIQHTAGDARAPQAGSLFVFMCLQRVSAKVLAEADFGGKALTGLLSPVEAEEEGSSRK